MMKSTDERYDTHMNDALARLRRTVEIPPTDPVREQALLAAFDAHWTQPRRKASRWTWSTAAALTATIFALIWLVATNAPRVEPVPAGPASDLAGFVPWPGSDGFPPFESGSLVRVDLPVSALPALGLPAPFSTVSVVQADIVVGQDGFARAVRLVQ
jgi:hypothetical protein